MWPARTSLALRPKCLRDGCPRQGSRARLGRSPASVLAFFHLPCCPVWICRWRSSLGPCFRATRPQSDSRRRWSPPWLRDLSRPDSVRKARSCVEAQPPSEPAKCLPNQAGMTGWQVASNSHSWTSANPVPMSFGRGTIATRVMRWVLTVRNRVSLHPCPGRRPGSRTSCR